MRMFTTTHGIPRFDDAWSVGIATLALTALPVLVLAIGMGRGGGGLMRELRGVLQFIVPLVLAAAVQWLVLRTALRRMGHAS